MGITIYLFIFFFILLFGFAHDYEMQENTFDLYYLVLKYITFNPK